jgi:hypothetical protein
MANYKVSMNEDKDTKCKQTKPKCYSEKAIQVKYISIYKNNSIQFFIIYVLCQQL